MTVTIGPCSPFFIITDLERSLTHYVDKLAFECRHRAPEEDPFFALVGRAEAQIMLKVTAPGVQPTPNRFVHEWAPWDTFIHVADPDALATEFADRGLAVQGGAVDREDGLRGFEVSDPDGYVIYFGRPISG